VEKGLLRLSVTFRLQKGDFSTKFDIPAKEGDLSAEVVNTGQHPLYVKRVRLLLPCSNANEGHELREFNPREI